MPIIPKYGPNTIPFKLKYRTIQVPIQDNTYTIIFILVPGTHTVKLGAPSPALTTSTLSKGVVGVSGPVNQYMSSSIASTTSWSSSDSSSVFCASQIFHTSAKSQGADLAEWRCITWLVKAFLLPVGTLCPKNVLVLKGTMKAKIRGC